MPDARPEMVRPGQRPELGLIGGPARYPRPAVAATGASVRPVERPGSPRVGVALCAFAAVLWAGSATVARGLIDQGASPLELSELRAFVAAIAFVAVTRATIRRRWTWPAFALGATIAGVNLSYFLAIERLPVAIAVIIQYTAPALVVGWELLVEHRRPSRTTIVALVAVLLGVTLISEPFESLGAGGGLDPIGVVFAALSAFGFAGYNLLAARAEREHGGTGAHARAFVVASGIWLLVQAPRGMPDTVLHERLLPGIAIVTLIGTVAAFGIYAQGIKRIGAAHATLTSTVEPVAAAVFAWVLLEQTLSTGQLLGAASVLAGIALLQPRRDATPEAPHPHAGSADT